MGLRVVGAGLGRTGTHSLKVALESLLGGTCYHMTELFPRPEHIPMWHGAITGEQQPDWDSMLEGFSAAVDWPAAAVWDDLHRAFPDSVVVLSVRDDAEAWWGSFSETILQVMKRGAPEGDPWFAMSVDMLSKLTPDYGDKDAAIAAYEAHNQRVRDTVEPGRLIEWTPKDGWGPLCEGLGLEVPDEPFPHVNTKDEFKAMAGLQD